MNNIMKGGLKSMGDDIQAMKEYLQAPQALSEAIREKAEDIQELRCCLLPHGTGYGVKVDTSPSDRFGRIMAVLADRERELEELKAERAAAVKSARAKINCLEDGREREILTLHYLNGWTMKKTAEKVGCCVKTAWRVNRSALIHLCEFQRVYEHDYARKCIK